MRFPNWVVVLAMLAASACVPAAAVDNVDACADEWSQIAELPQFAEQLARWQALAPKCAKSGIYELRLTGLLTMTRQFDQARKAVRSGLALNTPYKKELLGADAAITLNMMQLDKAQQQYQALIDSYPDYFDGYCGMGAVMLERRKFAEALDYLNQAARHGQSWIIYRHLTVAYAQLHQDEQAVQALDKAYRLHPQIVGDKDAMKAGARSLISLRNYRAADGTIKLLLRANPPAGADPEIQQTEQIIQQNLRDEAAK